MALKGIVIDPGHGGKDPGAVGNDIKEKDYTLLISKYMYERFKELGVNVKLVRDSDITLSPKERVKKANSFYGTDKNIILISNHLNSGGGEGAEIIYSLRNSNTLSKKILNNLENAGQSVRKYYQRRLSSNPKKDYYFMLRDTSNDESIIVEYGFVDSKSDVDRIKENYKKYVEAVIKAVCDYKGITYTSNSTDYYVVKKGDNLWDIAKKYNTTVDNIKSVNNLSTNVLKIGQVLYFNKNTSNNDNSGVENNYFLYKIVNGDSLSKIANQYDTSISDIKSLNNLNSDTLKIGEIIKVPGQFIVYTVKNGDNLWNLAKNYNNSVSKLKIYNNLNSDTLHIGQKLLIKK